MKLLLLIILMIAAGVTGGIGVVHKKEIVRLILILISELLIYVSGMFVATLAFIKI